MSEIEIPPAAVVRCFGSPRPSDGYKISGEYVFTDIEGEPFVVHDWKSTSLWNAEFPTPEEFWSSEEPDELSVASRDRDTAEFEHWFLSQIRIDSA